MSPDLPGTEIPVRQENLGILISCAASRTDKPIPMNTQTHLSIFQTHTQKRNIAKPFTQNTPVSQTLCETENRNMSAITHGYTKTSASIHGLHLLARQCSVLSKMWSAFDLRFAETSFPGSTAALQPQALIM